MEEIKIVTKNSKAKKPLNKKVIYIVVGVFVAILFLVGILTAFLSNYNTYAPDKVEVLDDGSAIYLKVKQNENYKGYRFVLKSSSGDEKIINSTTNVISKSELLESGAVPGEEYKVKVCYLSENDGNNSQFSPAVDFKFEYYLEQTEISLLQNGLTWSKVEGADYYIVYSTDQQKEFSADENSVSFDEFSGGIHYFSVGAFSNKDYLKSSLSKTMEKKIVKNIEQFSSVDLDQEYNLTVEGKDLFEKFYVFIDSERYQVLTESYSFDEETKVYKMRVNIKTIVSSGEKIGVSPMTIDEYNVYNGGILLYN